MIKENTTVYGTVMKEAFVLQMSSPGFGWVDLTERSREDKDQLTELGQIAKRTNPQHNFRVIRRLVVESVEVSLFEFGPVA